MNKQHQYKQALERHDDPRYTFEHYEYNRWFPSYNMTSEDLRNLRNENKKENVAYKITDRAVVISNNHGTHLKSYHTIVCAIINGEFYKTWEGFSSTTMKHINTYRTQNGFNSISKYDWVMMPTTEVITDNETGEILFEV